MNQWFNGESNEAQVPWICPRIIEYFGEVEEKK
jgi:hypothetical protein